MIAPHPAGKVQAKLAPLNNSEKAAKASFQPAPPGGAFASRSQAIAIFAISVLGNLSLLPTGD